MSIFWYLAIITVVYKPHYFKYRLSHKVALFLGLSIFSLLTSVTIDRDKYSFFNVGECASVPSKAITEIDSQKITLKLKLECSNFGFRFIPSENYYWTNKDYIYAQEGYFGNYNANDDSHFISLTSERLYKKEREEFDKQFPGLITSAKRITKLHAVTNTHDDLYVYLLDDNKIITCRNSCNTTTIIDVKPSEIKLAADKTSSTYSKVFLILLFLSNFFLYGYHFLYFSHSFLQGSCGVKKLDAIAQKLPLKAGALIGLIAFFWVQIKFIRGGFVAELANEKASKGVILAEMLVLLNLTLLYFYVAV